MSARRKDALEEALPTLDCREVVGVNTNDRMLSAMDYIVPQIRTDC